jgi:photosystem II stability/assembly factor-like uncharacterized protein
LDNVDYRRAVGVGFGVAGRDRLYAVGYFRLVMSNDDGHTWRLIREIRYKDGEFCSLSVAGPEGEEILYAGVTHPASGGPDEVVRSDDGGKTWHETALAGCVRLVVDPRESNTVYVLSHDGVQKSTDGGKTVEVLSDLPLDASDLEVSPVSSETLYVTGPIVNPGQYGVVRSDNGGRSWDEVWRTAWSFSGMPIGLSLNTDRFLVGTFERVYRTEDGGQTFASSDKGMSATTPLLISFSPLDPHTVLVSTGSAIALSRDGGSSWNDIGGPLGDPNQFRPAYFSGLAIDAAGSLFVSLARDFPPSAELYRSADNGVSWHRLTDIGARELLAHPTAPGFLLASTTSGVQLSLDGGLSWQQSSVSGFVDDLVIDEVSGDVYALTAAVPYGTEGEEGLYRSSTFGTQWTALEYPPIARASAMAALDGHLYISDGDRNLAVSRDGGSNWKLHDNQLGGFPSSIRGIAVDPLDPNRIAMASDAMGVLLSRDGGISWKPLQNVYWQQAGAIAFHPKVDPNDAVLSQRPLFAGMGGVWRIVPDPNPEHEARIEGEVKAGSVVRCETGEWSRTESVSYAWLNADSKKYPGANEPTFLVPKPNPNWDVYCRATGKGPGGTHRTVSWVHPIRR